MRKKTVVGGVIAAILLSIGLVAVPRLLARPRPSREERLQEKLDRFLNRDLQTYAYLEWEHRLHDVLPRRGWLRADVGARDIPGTKTGSFPQHVEIAVTDMATGKVVLAKEYPAFVLDVGQVATDSIRVPYNLPPGEYLADVRIVRHFPRFDANGAPATGLNGHKVSPFVIK